jgi:hypothetical protein
MAVIMTMARFYFAGQSPIRAVRSGPTTRRWKSPVWSRRQDHGLRDQSVRRLRFLLQPIDGITTASFEIRAAADAEALLAPLRESPTLDPGLNVRATAACTPWSTRAWSASA